VPPRHLLADRLLGRFDPVERYGLRLTLLGAALLLVAVPFGALLAQVITDGPATRWDTGIAEWLHQQVVGRHTVVTALQAVSFLGKPIWLVVVIGVPSLWLAGAGRWHLALFLVVTAVGGGVVDTVAKVAIGRPRPDLDAPVASAFGNSFPSGHAMSATVCYGALLLAFGGLLTQSGRRRALVAVTLLVLAIGSTRLVLGVHYVTDVLGGFVLGLAWLAFSVAAWEIWREDRGLRRTDPLDEGVEPEDLVDVGAAPDS
jgi:membrane-associated phospholipid phosphatase